MRQAMKEGIVVRIDRSCVAFALSLLLVGAVGCGRPDVAGRRVLGSHGYHVSAVVFSPDGTLLASCGNDKTIRLWDVASGKEVRSLRGHKAGVWGIAFSPDGGLLASAGSKDLAVRLWDVASGECIRVLEAHRHDITEVAFSPDGKLLASAGGTAPLVPTADGEGLTDPKPYPASRVNVWEVKTGEVVFSLSHPAGARSLAFSPDGRMLLTGGYDGLVRFWSLATQKTVRVAKGGVESLAFSADGKTIVTHGDHAIQLRNAADGTESSTFPVKGRIILSSARSPDGTLLVAGCIMMKTAERGPKEIRVWDINTRKLIALVDGFRHAISRVAFSPDGKTLATGGYRGTVTLWDVSELLTQYRTDEPAEPDLK